MANEIKFAHVDDYEITFINDDKEYRILGERLDIKDGFFVHVYKIEHIISDDRLDVLFDVDHAGGSVSVPYPGWPIIARYDNIDGIAIYGKAHISAPSYHLKLLIKQSIEHYIKEYHDE